MHTLRFLTVATLLGLIAIASARPASAQGQESADAYAFVSFSFSGSGWQKTNSIGVDPTVYIYALADIPPFSMSDAKSGTTTIKYVGTGRPTQISIAVTDLLPEKCTTRKVSSRP